MILSTLTEVPWFKTHQVSSRVGCTLYPRSGLRCFRCGAWARPNCANWSTPPFPWTYCVSKLTWSLDLVLPQWSAPRPGLIPRTTHCLEHKEKEEDKNDTFTCFIGIQCDEKCHTMGLRSHYSRGVQSVLVGIWVTDSFYLYLHRLGPIGFHVWGHNLPS